MAKTIYTAEAHVVGGRAQGHGVTSDGTIDVQLRPPTEGGGTNPEQLFAVGYAACFEGAIGAAARRMKVDPGDVAIDSKVSLVSTDDRGYTVAIALDVTASGVEGEQAAELIRTAHTVCPYSNATRGNVDVALTVNGDAV